MSKAAVLLISEIKEDRKVETKTYKIPYGLPNERRKAEIKLNVFKDGSKEEFLQFLLDFKRHAPRLGWNTAALKIESLESLLTGAAINQWQVACYRLDPDDPDSFEDALDKWKKKKNLNFTAMKDQLNYLRNVRKPREMTPEEMITRLQYMNLMIPEFIDATDADMLSDEEIKDIIYQAMPGGWKTNFINSGKEIHEESLESIERYMSTQQTYSIK